MIYIYILKYNPSYILIIHEIMYKRMKLTPNIILKHILKIYLKKINKRYLST
jgi:hypothetical protein